MGRYIVSRKIGRRVRQARKERKLTQEELADRANVHPSTIGRIERGEINATFPTLNQIAKELKIQLRELMP